MPLCGNCGDPMIAAGDGFVCSNVKVRTGVIQCLRCGCAALGMWPAGATLPFECANCFQRQAMPVPRMMAGP